MEGQEQWIDAFLPCPAQDPFAIHNHLTAPELYSLRSLSPYHQKRAKFLQHDITGFPILQAALLQEVNNVLFKELAFGYMGSLCMQRNVVTGLSCSFGRTTHGGIPHDVPRMAHQQPGESTWLNLCSLQAKGQLVRTSARKMRPAAESNKEWTLTYLSSSSDFISLTLRTESSSHYEIAHSPSLNFFGCRWVIPCTQNWKNLCLVTLSMPFKRSLKSQLCPKLQLVPSCPPTAQVSVATQRKAGVDSRHVPKPLLPPHSQLS